MFSTYVQQAPLHHSHYILGATTPSVKRKQSVFSSGAEQKARAKL